MRVFVLAVDALEYELVVDLGLRALMQRRYGYMEIPKEYYSEEAQAPYTPIIWTSIITGVRPGEHGVWSWWTYGRFLDWLRRKPPLVWIKGKRRILRKIGLRPRAYVRKDWSRDIETIFDKIKPSIPLWIPGYNEPSEHRWRLTDAMEEGGVTEYIRVAWEIHRERKKKLFEVLDEDSDWRLIMAWLDIADLLGHVCWHRCRDELVRAYRDLNLLAGRLAKRLSEQPTYMLIISDHGMQGAEDGVTGIHSTHAFWSTNMDDGWEPKDFTDIPRRILQIAGTGNTARA